MVDRAAAARAPVPSHGERQRAAPVVVDLRAEARAGRSSTGAIGRLRACGSPSKATGPSASAATGGRNRITVPASPQSTVASPRSVAGRDQPVGRLGVVAGDVLDRRRRASAGPAPSAACRGSAAAGAAGRAVGERGQHQVAVGQRLAAGQGDVGVDRAAARGSGPVAGRRRRSVCPPGVRSGTGAQVSASWACDATRRASRRALRVGVRATCLASRLLSAAARRASLAARCARQARPGLPSVSTAASSRPPSRPRFLRKCVPARRAWPGRSPPRTGGRNVVGTRDAARTREARRGRRPRPSSARGDHRGAVGPDQQLGVVGQAAAARPARGHRRRPWPAPPGWRSGSRPARRTWRRASDGPGGGRGSWSPSQRPDRSYRSCLPVRTTASLG